MSQAPGPSGQDAVDARTGKLLRWSFGSLILAYGLFTLGPDSVFWALLSTLLFALPLALQWTSWVRLRAYALWFGSFLVIQSLLGPFVRNDFVTLPPNLRSTVDVRTKDGPGMRPGLRRITTDAKGFRVQPEVDYAKKTVTRIIAVGGSTTEDIMLGDDSTWTHLLQESLKARNHPAEVINTGVSGLRAKNHLASIRRVAALQPDLLLILVGGNDWNKHIRDAHEPSRDAYRPPQFHHSPLGGILSSLVVTPLRRLVVGQSSWDQHLVIERPDGFNGDKPQQSRQRSTRHVFRPTAVADSYRREMDEISRTCRERALRCVFLTQPHAYAETTPDDLRRLLWMTPPYATYTLDLGSMMHVAALYNTFLAELARRDGHALCDVAAGMEASSRLFYDDMHYTDEGARRMADLVLPCVEKLLVKQ